MNKEEIYRKVKVDERLPSIANENYLTISEKGFETARFFNGSRFEIAHYEGKIIYWLEKCNLSELTTTPPKSTVSDKLAEEISQMSDVDFNKGVDELMKFVKPKSTVSAEEIIDKYFKYNEFDKKRVIEAMEEYRTQPAKFIPKRTAQEEAERLVKSYGEAFRGDDNVFAIQDITNTITALQLRGIDTSYEESVLNILKGM